MGTYFPAFPPLLTNRSIRPLVRTATGVPPLSLDGECSRVVFPLPSGRGACSRGAPSLQLVQGYSSCHRFASMFHTHFLWAPALAEDGSYGRLYDAAGMLSTATTPHCAGYHDSCLSLGRVMLKTAPLPAELETFMVPLCSFTIRSAMDSPSPDPPYSLERDLSIR